MSGMDCVLKSPLRNPVGSITCHLQIPHELLTRTRHRRLRAYLYEIGLKNPKVF